MVINYDKIRVLTEIFEASLPRYTSYPTAPDWQDCQPDLAESLIQISGSKQRKLSLYVHIPFCESRCYFCGCNTIISKDITKADPYLAHLAKEVEGVSRIWHDSRLQSEQPSSDTQEVFQVHFGGGTPTFLNAPRMRQVDGILKNNFTFAEAVSLEYSIEIDPAVTTEHHLEACKEMGVNRLSFGIQDFHEEILEAVNRPQKEKDVTALYQRARDLQFEGVNFDLIYGLPGQNLENWEETIQKVIALKPNRIALFSYAHVPWVKPHQKVLEKQKFLTGFPKFELFLRALELLTDNGYDYIGLDHFALSTDSLSRARLEKRLHRNFQGYTTRGDLDLFAFGVTSISGSAEGFWQNPRELPDYYKETIQGKIPVIRGHRSTQEDLYRKKLILDILCHGEYYKQDQQKFLSDILYQEEEFLTFLNYGLLEETPDAFSLTIEGQLFARNIASIFDAYLLKRKEEKQQNIFSKTI